ncbi:MAG TPA: TatD family hydrolase [Victivallales bacterium]|nr:TatD family hydrolase [Victivallales bacterium]HPO91089.1 TatD family hydrolase [Victivallales bacterium]HRR05885.1 TatD family hydrolase [Victivallales bacterium]HRU00083.1 TatD family hydrolase [Victivallales bacterium]
MSAFFFDTHAHIDENENPLDFRFSTRENRVEYILICGSDIRTSHLSANFAKSIENVFFSAGIHPHSAEENTLSLRELLKEEKCVAIGESGLDYFYNFTKKELQVSSFRKQIDSALESSLPLIVHCRDKENFDSAYEDCFNCLLDFTKAGGKFVMHCFTGSEIWLKEFLKIGAYIGYGGIITFPKGENVRKLLKITPIDRILFETDSPYLTPVPHRGKTNHPKFLPIIARKAAEILSTSEEDIAKISLKNSFKLFKKAKKIENSI